MAAPVKQGFYRIELNKTVWDVPQHYQLLCPIGLGAYGQVCSAVNTKHNEKVAIKKLARPFLSDIHAKRTYRELCMLKHMEHENIINLLDVFTPQTCLDTFQDVYMVSPLMGADLNNILKTQKLSDDHVQFLVYQILRGLKYIHSAGIIHRDLKPGNLAVNEDCELRILDFGLARHTEDTMTGYVATRWYRAPEIMLNWMSYDQTVDIWSVGCILAEMLTGKALFPGTDLDMWSIGCVMAEMLTGKPLFPGSDNIDQLTRILALVGTPDDDLLEDIKSPDARSFIKSLPKQRKKDFREVFLGANPEAISLLEKMLQLDVKKRINTVEALAHPYIKQYADPSDEPCSKPYDQSFEDLKLTVPEWRKSVYDEICKFVPRQL